MWKVIFDFVVGHWKAISFGSVVSGLGILARFWTWFRQRGVKHLARKLRAYADEAKRKNPNIFAFPRQTLAEHLGHSEKKTGEVLEFMEEKGWATKVRFPVDCWQIK
jgi:hypothetical protein